MEPNLNSRRDGGGDIHRKHRTLKDELVWEKEKRAMDVFSVRPQ